ncbi:MAG: hypothetical protein U0800_17905 [Isosphaeraceae bacterium]
MRRIRIRTVLLAVVFLGMLLTIAIQQVRIARLGSELQVSRAEAEVRTVMLVEVQEQFRQSMAQATASGAASNTPQE